MNDVELLAEWVQDFAHEVRNEIAALSLEELTWQPDARGNSIGVTVWHVSRWLDFLLVGGTTGTAYQWLKMVIKGGQRHLGEIQAFKAMQARARQASLTV